jgi:hypothetical protein
LPFAVQNDKAVATVLEIPPGVSPETVVRVSAVADTNMNK